MTDERQKPLFRIDIVGDQAVMIRLLGDPPDRLERLTQALEMLQSRISERDGWTDCSLGYHAILLHLDALRTHPVHVAQELRELFTLSGQWDKRSSEDAQAIVIPVLYGGMDGPDLEEVARQTKLTPDEVIHLHESGLYRVAMIGFAPGFPYLEGLDPRLATPRKSVPRREVAKGSVGIAGIQTGVYSFATPGGWQIIGRTPTSLFDVTREQPSLLRPGMFVRFTRVTQEEFDVKTKRQA